MLRDLFCLVDTAPCTGEVHHSFHHTLASPSKGRWRGVIFHQSQAPLVQGGVPQSFTNPKPPLCKGGCRTAGVTGGLFAETADL